MQDSLEGAMEMDIDSEKEYMSIVDVNEDRMDVDSAESKQTGAMSKDNDSSMDVDEAEIGQMMHSEISRGIFHSFTLSSLQGTMSIVDDNEDDRIDVDEAEINQMANANGYDRMDIDGIGRDELGDTDVGMDVD
ncbi:hypothetical protein P692DRAFT_20817249 [Suillus brevipes Sb2]|nr:hypothetical protein P692DRAFT_20817249 [Suillus brevipes Sb2]